DAGSAISPQLEDAVGDGRGHVVELLLSAVSWSDPQPADHRVSLTFAAPHSRQTADRLGRVTRSPQSDGMGLRSPATWPTLVGGSCLPMPRNSTLWSICGRTGSSTSYPTSAPQLSG